MHCSILICPKSNSLLTCVIESALFVDVLSLLLSHCPRGLCIFLGWEVSRLPNLKNIHEPSHGRGFLEKFYSDYAVECVWKLLTYIGVIFGFFRIGLFHGEIYFYKFRSSRLWSSILICSGVVSTIALLFFFTYLLCRWRKRWNSFKSLVLHGPHNRRAEKVSFFGVEYVFIS